MSRLALSIAIAPSLAAVRGQKHANLSTAHVSIQCDDKNKCELVVDLERHGRPTAERWVRYTAPLADKTPKSLAAAAPKLKDIGPPPDAPTAGLAVKELSLGTVRPRSGADPADKAAAECLTKALRTLQMECPRDGKVIDVRTAICL